MDDAETNKTDPVFQNYTNLDVCEKGNLPNTISKATSRETENKGRGLKRKSTTMRDGCETGWRRDMKRMSKTKSSDDRFETDESKWGNLKWKSDKSTTNLDACEKRDLANTISKATSRETENKGRGLKHKSTTNISYDRRDSFETGWSQESTKSHYGRSDCREIDGSKGVHLKRKSDGNQDHDLKHNSTTKSHYGRLDCRETDGSKGVHLKRKSDGSQNRDLKHNSTNKSHYGRSDCLEIDGSKGVHLKWKSDGSQDRDLKHNSTTNSHYGGSDCREIDGKQGGHLKQKSTMKIPYDRSDRDASFTSGRQRSRRKDYNGSRRNRRRSSHHRKRKKRKSCKISVWWDVENFGLNQLFDEGNITVNIETALRDINVRGEVEVFGYANLDNVIESVQNKFLASNVKLIHVPDSGKDSTDKWMLVDMPFWAWDNNDHPGVVVLITGDGGFVHLVERLRERGCKVILGAPSGSTAEELKQSCPVVWNALELIRGHGPDKNMGEGDFDEERRRNAEAFRAEQQSRPDFERWNPQETTGLAEEITGLADTHDDH